MATTLEEKYLHDSSILAKVPGRFSGHVTWECPSNVALVKYWGKRPIQIPMNPSVSFTLREAKTKITVDFKSKSGRNGISLKFYFEGKPAGSFGERVRNYLHQSLRYLPFLDQADLVINTSNTFPHSTGIASSASSFGALALSLCSMEKMIFGTLQSPGALLEKASFLARLGSGSACRSVYGGFSLWGRTDGRELSTDEAAMPLNSEIHPSFSDLGDIILVIRSGAKEVSSQEGHGLMEGHPYAAARFLQARANLEEMLGILGKGDENAFAVLAEEEALTLHAMMITSRPGYLLMKPDTLRAIDRIRHFRSDTGLPVCFTLDAGPNVHLLYPARIAPQVRSFAESDLSVLCEDARMIHDGVGSGPVMLNG